LPTRWTQPIGGENRGPHNEREMRLESGWDDMAYASHTTPPGKPDRSHILNISHLILCTQYRENCKSRRSKKILQLAPEKQKDSILGGCYVRIPVIHPPGGVLGQKILHLSGEKQKRFCFRGCYLRICLHTILFRTKASHVTRGSLQINRRS
jgi:hypothetical protein